MLIELDIRDFALIEHIKISWSQGLNILTGETGAGKSIIIDAISAVLGGKAGNNNIRTGADRAIIEAIFKQNPDVAGWLKQQELQNEDDDHHLIVAREISKSGSRTRINGTLVNQSLVQDLRTKLLTIHTQHEARTLLSSQLQLELLDGLGDNDHKKSLNNARTYYAKHKELITSLKELVISEEERARRLDFAKFQLGELQEADLQSPEEFESLSQQSKVLSNVVQIESATLKAQEYINGGDNDTACAIDLVQNALSELEKASDLDQQLADISIALHESLAHLEESVRSLRHYRETIDTDPESLNRIETRIDQLASIKRKYGPELLDAINRKNALTAEIDKLESTQANADQIQTEIAQIEKQMKKTNLDLRNRRQKLATTLVQSIQNELKDLGMEHCRFEISFETVDANPSGEDRIEFLIAPNPGQPLMPLSKIASGGELSRVMLAVKSIFAKADRVATVIFDEIDTGLSGRTLQSMRDKLASLARSHQILCITHQPIIASVADNHLQINKTQSATSTHISISSLSSEERVKSLAGMASGQENQKDALQFARSLYEEASKLRIMP